MQREQDVYQHISRGLATFRAKRYIRPYASISHHFNQSHVLKGDSLFCTPYPQFTQTGVGVIDAPRVCAAPSWWGATQRCQCGRWEAGGGAAGRRLATQHSAAEVRSPRCNATPRCHVTPRVIKPGSKHSVTAGLNEAESCKSAQAVCRLHHTVTFHSVAVKFAHRHTSSCFHNSIFLKRQGCTDQKNSSNTNLSSVTVW